MRGKGIPHLNKPGKGDQLVRVNIWIPGKVSKTAKDLFKQLGQMKEIEPS
jgi:molecular chaperone DnaJ